MYLRETNQTIVSAAEGFTVQGEAALLLPEGAWVMGAVTVMTLILLAISLISKGKKIHRRVVPSVCVEQTNRMRTNHRSSWFVEEMKLRLCLLTLRRGLAPISILLCLAGEESMEVNSPFIPLFL